MTNDGGGEWRVAATLADEAATKRLGIRIADMLSAGDVIALSGGLGAGKTSLARAIIQHLAGAEVEVPSPTFTLVQEYPDLPIPVVHYDLYRLRSPDDLAEIGLGELDAGAALLVEWPERAETLLRYQILMITLSIDGAGRRAELSGAAHWQQRLGTLPERI